MAKRAATRATQPQVLLSASDILTLVGEPLVCTDAAGLIVLFNQAAEETFGYRSDEVLGQPVELLIPQRYQSKHRDHVSNFAGGTGAAKRIMGQKREICAQRKNGEEFPAEAIVTRQAVEGRAYMTVALRDITERKDLERERELVSRELTHRVKNVLTIVDALVLLTSNEAKDVDELARALRQRLGALARTQDSIGKNSGQGAALGELLRKELEPYEARDGANMRFQGPEIDVKASAALTLALAFHELATNSAKYGALSIPGGILYVVWRLSDRTGRKWVEISWRETGGPCVRPPERLGFGTRLITESVKRGLQATVDLAYSPEGLTCDMHIPLRAL